MKGQNMKRLVVAGLIGALVGVSYLSPGSGIITRVKRKPLPPDNTAKSKAAIAAAEAKRQRKNAKRLLERSA